MNRPALLLTLLALTAPFAIATAAPAAAATPKCHGFPATIKGTVSNDELYGTSGNDVIVARAGNDQVFGGGGKDIICGNGGADRLSGGPGNDGLFGGKDAFFTRANGTHRNGDALIGGIGDDVLDTGVDGRAAAHVRPDSILWINAANPVTVNVAARSATGEGHDFLTQSGAVLIGSANGDTFIGGPTADLIVGNGGPDVINGNGGDDQIVSDSTTASTAGDNDQVLGGAGNDKIYNSFGGDIVSGGPDNDQIRNNAGVPNSLNGGGGNDTILTELAAGQVLDGSDGVDELGLLSNVLNPTGAAAAGQWDMATGAMTFTINTPINLTAAGFEEGVLSTFGATWDVVGTGGDDTLNVATTNGAVFQGLAGNDTFTGSLSNDTFNGGADTDHAIAMGGGFDTCVSVEVRDVNDCEAVTP